MMFDQFATLAEAAALGFGLALLPDYLAEAEIARGRLVRAYPGRTEAAGRYYLVWPESAEPRPPLRDLIAWLEKERREPREGAEGAEGAAVT